MAFGSRRFRSCGVVVGLVTVAACLSARDACASNFNGVSFVRAKWYDRFYNERSYNAFKSYLKKSNKNMSEGDFYFALVVSPKVKSIAGSCEDESARFQDFLNGFLGNTDAAMSVTTLSATKGAGHIGDQQFLKQLPLFYAGKGVDPSNGTASPNSCFFNYYQALHEPFMRYDKGSNQDVTLDFGVMQSNKLTSNAVGTLKDLLSGATAAFSIANPTAGAAGPVVASATADLQAAINSSFSHGNAIVHTETLSPGQDKVLYVSSVFQPNSSGGVLLYLRRSASIILDETSGPLDPETVRDNGDIGVARCLPMLPTAAADCSNRPVAKTFKEAYQAHAKDSPPRYFDLSDAGMKNVYNTCDDIRFFASGMLRLSTLDALLVRWAAVREGLLDRALSDPAKRAKIASASGVDPSDLDKCWSASDQQLVDGMSKELDPSH